MKIGGQYSRHSLEKILMSYFLGHPVVSSIHFSDFTHLTYYVGRHDVMCCCVA